MADLAKTNYLPVTISGRLHASNLSGDSCYYSEWALAKYNPDASGTFESIYKSVDSLIVITPLGHLPVDIFSVRLYLGAYASRTYNSENASIAPLAVQRKIEEINAEVAVREYMLAPNHTYYARVVADSSSITVESAAGGPVSRPTFSILEISDRPFDDGVPQRPPTPSYR